MSIYIGSHRYYGDASPRPCYITVEDRDIVGPGGVLREIRSPSSGLDHFVAAQDLIDRLSFRFPPIPDCFTERMAPDGESKVVRVALRTCIGERIGECVAAAACIQIFWELNYPRDPSFVLMGWSGRHAHAFAVSRFGDAGYHVIDPSNGFPAVSYTHLTLPTIYSV